MYGLIIFITLYSRFQLTFTMTTTNPQLDPYVANAVNTDITLQQKVTGTVIFVAIIDPLTPTAHGNPNRSSQDSPNRADGNADYAFS
jgi:hypothetical protein